VRYYKIFVTKSIEKSTHNFTLKMQNKRQMYNTNVRLTDVDCGKPEHIQHGRYTLTSNATYYGAAALYECDGNFELDGFARRLCLENSTWSSDTPVCRGIIKDNSSKKENNYKR